MKINVNKELVTNDKSMKNKKTSTTRLLRRFLLNTQYDKRGVIARDKIDIKPKIYRAHNTDAYIDNNILPQHVFLVERSSRKQCMIKTLSGLLINPKSLIFRHFRLRNNSKPPSKKVFMNFLGTKKPERVFLWYIECRKYC